MTTATEPISAVLFDCDGVLVESEVLAHEIEMALLAEIGLTYDSREFSRRFMGASDAAFYEALEADGWARLGRSIRNEFEEPLRHRIRTAFRERLTEVAGARVTLATLVCPKAVASSSHARSLQSKLQMVGLWDLFAPHVYSADDVAHAKPAPDLFLHAAQQLGIEPFRCLVIEDSLNGIRAAQAAGMRVWGFAGGAHHDAESAEWLSAAGTDKTLHSWTEMAAEFVAHQLTRQ